MDERHTEALAALLATVRTLVGPGGCPWDRAQTLESLAPYLVEESWETLDAVRNRGRAEVCEELGDVLMLVFLMCEIARKEKSFSLPEVAREVNAKLIRRHPHVFGDTAVSGPGEVLRNWEEIKKSEGKKAEKDGLPSLPEGLPALTRAVKLGKAASKLGFDWPDLGGPMGKISEEWAELKEAVAGGDARAIEDEVGDLLFAVTNLCRATGTDPEWALRAACDRFRRRFAVVAERGGLENPADLSRMEKLWEEAKEMERGGSSRQETALSEEE